MLICHVVVLLKDDVKEIEFEGFIPPGGMIGTNIFFDDFYHFQIDGAINGHQDVEFRSQTGIAGKEAFLADDVDPEYKLGFYGVRPL